MPALTDWLLEGPAYVRYATRRDLLGVAADDPSQRVDRQDMLGDEAVRAVIDKVATWPWPPLQRHNDAKHPSHALAFLADLGLSVDDGLGDLVKALLAGVTAEGIVEQPMQIPTRFGGTGEIAPRWMLCDAPLLLAVLHDLGVRDTRLDAGAAFVMSLVRDNGWPCAATPDLGRFRGPGPKDDPCPYANLLMLRLCSRLPEWRNSEAARLGAESMLQRWTERGQSKPYMFGIGTTFLRPKAPLIWYDVLHVLDTLSRFAWLRSDPRLDEMAALLRDQANEDGRWKAGSVWMAWKGWEFCQKREPSRWITFLATRALSRLGDEA